MATNLVIERHGATALVLLDRPDVRNALNYELIDEAAQALVALNRDKDCRAVVLSGTGDRAFCAGMDLAVVRRLDADTSADWLVRLKRLYETRRCAGSTNPRSQH